MITPFVLVTLSLASANPCHEALDAFTKARSNKQYAVAEAAVQKAVALCDKELKPAWKAWLHENLADVRLHQEKWQAGLAAADACIANEAGNPTCHFYRWFALRRLGRWKDVDAEKPVTAKAFDTLLALKPDPSVKSDEQPRLADRQDVAKGLYDIFRKTPDRD
jgi:hypothetical protein